MKNKVSIISIFVVLSVILFISISSGCSGRNNNFDVSGQTTDNIYKDKILSSVEEVEELVTDNNKLVINYFDAYTWVVYFDDDGKIQDMIYIYEFEDASKAESMVSVRTQELLKNKTMSVNDSYNLGNYVIICLVDTSFTNVSRAILENNFNGLIVY